MYYTCLKREKYSELFVRKIKIVIDQLRPNNICALFASTNTMYNILFMMKPNQFSCKTYSFLLID